jgi:predicted Rossmann fold flavoprotein
VEVAGKLLAHALRSGVTLRCDSRIKRFLVEGNHLTAVELTTKEVIPGRAFVLATGGASYPATGSSGDGYVLARGLGHRLTAVRPALVAVETKGESAPNLQGLSLVNAQVNVWVDGRKAGEAFGELLFTHFGLSGPIVLTLSRRFNEVIQTKRDVVFAIDLKPALDDRKLDQRLQRDLDAHGKTKLANLFKEWLPSKLIPEFLRLLALDGQKLANQVSAEERKKIRLLMKDFRFPVTGLRPFEEAIITSGGVALEQIHSKTLASKLHPNLFFAGEVLDLDANTGGYNLQIAFSTGVLAGESAARWVQACPVIG